MQKDTSNKIDELLLSPAFHKILALLPVDDQVSASLTCKKVYAETQHFWAKEHLWVGTKLKLKVLFCEPSISVEAQHKARELFQTLPRATRTSNGSNCQLCCLESETAPSAFIRGNIEYHVWQAKYPICHTRTNNTITESELKNVNNIPWEAECENTTRHSKYYRQITHARDVDIAVLCFDKAIDFYAHQELQRQNPHLGMEVICVCTDPDMGKSWLPMQRLAIDNILRGKTQVCFCSADNSKKLLDIINAIGFRIAKRKVEERKVRHRTLCSLDADIDSGFETEFSAKANMRHWWDFI